MKDVILLSFGGLIESATREDAVGLAIAVFPFLHRAIIATKPLNTRFFSSASHYKRHDNPACPKHRYDKNIEHIFKGGALPLTSRIT